MSDPEHSTRDVVREMIERDGSIKIGLARGLINERALARYIQKETHERYTFEALVSAVRRYPIHEGTRMRTTAGKAIRKIELKNNICVILLRNRAELQPMLAKFVGELDHAGGDTFRIITTARAVKLEIDSKNADELLARLQGETYSSGGTTWRKSASKHPRSCGTPQGSSLPCLRSSQ